MGVIGDEAFAHLAKGGGVDVALADRLSENVLSTFALPFGVALNFTINGRDLFVPMAIEEPSVVAAASNAARMVRATGGFFGDADAPIMTAQIQLDDVPDPTRAGRGSSRRRRASRPWATRRSRGWSRAAEACVTSRCACSPRRSACSSCTSTSTSATAMGANPVDTVAEAIAPEVLAIAGGTMGLRILTNLPLRTAASACAPRCATRLWAAPSSRWASLARAASPSSIPSAPSRTTRAS